MLNSRNPEAGIKQTINKGGKTRQNQKNGWVPKYDISLHVTQPLNIPLSMLKDVVDQLNSISELLTEDLQF